MTQKLDLLGRLELQVVRDPETGARKIVFRNQNGELVEPKDNADLMATLGLGSGGNGQAPVVDLSGLLQKSSNLSDLSDPAAARSNLGLGSALLAANNLSDVASPAVARSSLGLGAAAQKSMNQIASDPALDLAGIRSAIAIAPPTGVAATDTANIQNALDAAYSAGGGNVVLRAGVYVIAAPTTASNGSLQLKDNVALAGAGVGVTVLRVAAGNGADITGIVRTPSAVATKKVTVRDLTIDGNKGAATGTPRTIGFYCGVSPNGTVTDEDISLINVEVMNCGDYGFDPHERTTRLRFINCTSHDNVMDGFTLDACYDAQLTGCISYNNGRHGYNLVTATADSTLNGCTAYGNGGNGVTLQQGAKRNVITGGSFHGNTGDGVVINGVAMTGSQQDLTPGAYNKVTGASIYANGGNGIALVSATGNDIIANKILDNSKAATNTSSGIYLTDDGTSFSTGNRIMMNAIRSTGTPAHKYGIREKAAGDDQNFVLGNVVSGSATTNVSLQGPNSLSLAAHNGVNEHPAVPSYIADNPSNHGYKDWNYDLSTLGSSTGATANVGNIFLMRLDAQTAGPITSVNAIVGSAGTGLVNCFAAIYDVATGVLLGTTADQASAWQSTGVKSMALTTPTAPVSVGQKLWVALLANGTTAPQFVRSGATSATQVNAGMTTLSPLRFSVYGTTGQTSMPANINYAGTTASGANTFWVATA